MVVPTSGGGRLLGRTFGISMWPALRPGDLLFGHPLGKDERPPPGTVLVAQGPRGPIAHRLVRLTGAGSSERFRLSGDLSGPDYPLSRDAIEGVAMALNRRGVFLDVPAAMPQGALSRPLLLGVLSLLLSASRRGSLPRVGENQIELAIDVAAVQRALEK